MPEAFQDSRVETRCAELRVREFRTPAEDEELAFLEEYLRDKPRLDIERLKARGLHLSPGNTAADVARALERLRPQES